MGLADALEKAVGKSDERQEVDTWVDTGFPPLNRALSGSYEGGLPIRRIVEIAGPPSSGKTMIATAAMVSAQKAGGFAMFMDHERSFDVSLAESYGLNTSGDNWLYKLPKTFEESLDMAIETARVIREGDYIEPLAPIVVTFDSLASMNPKSKVDKKASDFNMNDNTALSRATSASFPPLVHFVEEYDICCIFLNQVRNKIGVMFGDPRTTPGGDAPKFYASVRVMLSASQRKKEKKILGQTVTANVIKNKVYKPFESATWDFDFLDDGTGKMNVCKGVIDELIEKGVLEQKGARVTWTDGKSYFKGDLAKQLEETPEELVALLPDA